MTLNWKPAAAVLAASLVLSGCSALNPFGRGGDQQSIAAPVSFPPFSSVINQPISAPVVNSVDSNIAAVTRGAPVGRYSLGNAYTANGRQYIPRENLNYQISGGASWTGSNANGQRTANGETFSANSLTAAHPTLPYSSVVEVTNSSNGRKVVVRINDRGPFNGDVIDLTQRAAQQLGLPATAGTSVRVRLLQDETRKLAGLTGSGIGLAPITTTTPANSFASVPAPAPIPTINVGAINSRPVTSTVAQPTQVQPVQIANIPAATPIASQPITTSSAPASSSSSSSVAALPDLPTVNTGGSGASTGGVSGSGFFVQAGSFSAPANANQLKGRLSQFGSTQVAQNGGAYRVLVGPFSSRQQAQATLGRVIGSGAFDATIIEQ